MLQEPRQHARGGGGGRGRLPPPGSLGLGHGTRGCAPPKHGQGEVGGMWVGNAGCTHAGRKRKKKKPQTNPKSTAKMVSVLSCPQEAPPSSVRSPAPLQQGRRVCSRWQRQLDGRGTPEPLLCSPLLPLPTALSLSSYSGPPHTEAAPRRWEGARRPPAAPVGPAAERALPLAPGEGSCWLWGPA